MNIPLPANETQRLAALKRYAILDTAPEAAFDRITRLAARLFGVPIVLVSLLDAERQWFKACYGVDMRQTDRDIAFCTYAILSDSVMVVPDATQDERFAKNPLVTGEPGIRFYAGAPLRTREGFNLGTLCLLDMKTRGFSDEQREALDDLAALVVDELELRRGTNQLRESETRKAAILETALDCIITIDDQSHVLEWNPAAERTFGYSKEQALGRQLPELIIPPEFRQRHLDGMKRYLATGEGPVLNRRVELPAVTATGRALITEVAIIPIPDTHPPLFTGHLRDITEKKADEERLRLLESVAVHANDAILITEAEPVEGPDGPRILYANQAYCRMSGYELEEIIGQTPRIVQGKGTSRETCNRIYASLKKWKPIVVEVLNYRKDGTEFWVELSIVPIANESGWYTHWVSIQRDIGERKNSEAALMAARDEAERANHAKSEFLSRMSHELRTPLNAILGFGQLLEMTELASDDAQSAEQIVKAGRHLLALINEVLDIARIESGHLSTSPEPVGVREIVLESLDLMRPLAAQRGIVWDEGTVRDCPLFVQADRQRFKQVLLNLLANAIKYNRENGRVSLICEEFDAQGEARLRIGVRDTGHGIAPDKMDRLFTPFDRLGAESSTVEGTGVGLALAQRLMVAMKGNLTVESEVEIGSTFWIDFPLAPHPLDNFAFEEAKSSRAGVDTRRVLLYIEDNLANLQLLQRILQHRPEIKLLTAMQGGLGLELARQHRPDLILLDLNLPEMSGGEVLKALREDEITRDTPVIVISADATQRQIERMLESGAQDYLTKPYDVSELMRVLDENKQRV